MVGGEDKGAGMLLPKVQLDIPRRRIGQHIAARGVFHAALPAVVNGKQASIRHIAALKLRHVEVVKAEYGSREYFIGGHGALAGLIAELPDGAAVTMGQQNGTRIVSVLWSHPMTRSCTANLISYT